MRAPLLIMSAVLLAGSLGACTGSRVPGTGRLRREVGTAAGAARQECGQQHHRRAQDPSIHVRFLPDR